MIQFQDLSMLLYDEYFIVIKNELYYIVIYTIINY